MPRAALELGTARACGVAVTGRYATAPQVSYSPPAHCPPLRVALSFWQVVGGRYTIEVNQVDLARSQSQLQKGAMTRGDHIFDTSTSTTMTLLISLSQLS